MSGLLLLLALLAGLFRAVHDALEHDSANRLVRWAYARRSPRWALFIDPAISWKNKYANGDPDAGPAFWGSTTLLVALTDAWHLSNLLAWGCADAALVLVAWAGPWRWWAAGYVVVRRVVFEPLYRWWRYA